MIRSHAHCIYDHQYCLTRFNKIVILDNKTDDEWTMKPVVYKVPQIFHLYIIRTYGIFTNFIIYIFTLLAFTQSVDTLFH